MAGGQLSRVHPVAFICSHYGRAKHLYATVLGLRIVAENYRAERDSSKLDLATPDADPDGLPLELYED